MLNSIFLAFESFRKDFAVYYDVLCFESEHPILMLFMFFSFFFFPSLGQLSGFSLCSGFKMHHNVVYLEF